MNILITGANRGLGYYLAKIGLAKGHKIFACVREINPQKINLLTELKNVYHEQLQIIQLDVVDESSVVKAKELLKENGFTLDSIINNAGILLERDKTIEALDLGEVLKTLDVNTLGPIRVLKHFLPMLEQGEKQSIINISSEAGSITNAYSGDYPYGLSKVALNMLSEKLNVYLKDRDIKVYAVHPGWMKTDMGGDNAPTDPVNTAEGIYKIVERKVEITNKSVFVDYNGQPMTI